MKSQPLENNLTIVKTSCKNCIFAIYDKNTQYGCEHDRINKFKNLSTNLVIEAYDNDSNFFVINKFCNFYRDKTTWNNGNVDINKVEEEAKITFDILLNCDDIDDEYLEWLIQFVKEVNEYNSHDTRKAIIHIYHANNISKEQKQKVSSISKMIKGNNSINIYFDKNILDYHIVSKSKQSYHTCISKTQRPNINVLSNVNEEINTNLKKLLVIKNNNVYLYSNLSCKIEITNNNNKNIDDIRQKIIQFSQQQYYIELL